MFRWLHQCSLSFVMFCSLAASAQTAAPSRTQDVIDVDNRLFIQTDAKNWSAVEQVFAPSVAFDMTSLAGGKPQTLTPQQISKAWSEGLANVQAVHHQVGNYVVTFDRSGAKVFCNGMATHYKPKEARKVTWFVGTYDLHLIQDANKNWVIDAFKFNVKYVD